MTKRQEDEDVVERSRLKYHPVGRAGTLANSNPLAESQNFGRYKYRDRSR